MKPLFRLLFRIVGLLFMLLLVAFVIIWIREWRPEPVENILETESKAVLRQGDTLRIVSWNIGYAGLGDDMDFFYDGGTRMRTSRERTLQNLHGIIRYLQEQADAHRADLILLQEVDFDSHRSYGLNEYDSIRNALSGYESWYALNYKSDFVPIPLTHPMGAVESGIVILSRWSPSRVTRYAYPGGFSFPVRLFNLKRCLLSAEFPLLDSTGNLRTLYINNTHNTAYDTGNMRSGELAFMNRYLADKPYAVTLGDWNCNPPGYTASAAALADANFRPLPIDRGTFPDEMTFVYDPTTPSTRYGYEPYNPATTTTTLLDFALCGSGIEPIAFETVDLGFKNSDHNPVIATFVIR